MRILVVGAIGALGRDVVDQTLADGHVAVGLVRSHGRVPLSASAALTHGDVLDPSSLPPALSGVNAVVCALGTPSPRQRTTLLRDGTANLVAAMREEGIRRLVCVTLLGAGRSRSNASVFYRTAILRALAPMLPDKEAQEDVVRASGLDWTLVRPPRFANGRARGTIRVIGEGEAGRVGHVVRRDLARFVVDCATRDFHVGQAVVVGS